ncbi:MULTISPECIES: LysM peptidoglycan-binding domain-containing protein [Streptacidiphilus]|uniref:LysM peptidoglycan-binding domain-containing protein n=1 Tax=Streptacidiphilus cavernicola TaxID=3342716 RepID=A0ABV6UW94_9ACTN|nr:LysM peptidoglycan-binding domain-containing protein [Streptacidiphilus jeojiense]
MNSRIRALAGALGSLLFLALIEIGAPVGLLAFGLLPHRLPTLTQAGTALTSPDNGSLLIGAITLIGWLAWVAFTFAVVLETLAALRHRGAPRVRTLGALQQLAAGLVASIIVLLPATGGALAASAAPAAAATLHLPHASTLTAGQAAQQAEAATTNAGNAGVQAGWSGPVHQVTGSDESMWDLAEHYLGDGMRWREIAQLNQGVPQPDGKTVTATTLQLTPGWTLRLPADARTTSTTSVRDQVEPAAATETVPSHQQSAAGTPATRSGTSEKVHVVRPGDTLSQIAQDDLGDPNDYPQIAAANQHTVQSDGRHLTDPNLIYPGWKLTIPQASQATAAPADPTTGAKAPAPTGKPGAATSGPSGTSTSGGTATVPHPTAAPTTPVASAPAAPPTTPPAAAPSTAPATGQSATAATPTPAPTAPPTLAAVPAVTARAAQTSSPARVGAGIAALLAAGLLGGYGVKRALQQRNRRPGETIAVPEQTSALEHALVHQAQPPSAELLDRALRTLAAHLPDHQALPPVEGARLTRAGIELRCPAEAVSPFTAAGDGWWQLDPEQELLDPDQADQIPAPYPLLTALGTDGDNGAVLADLRTARTVLLDGSPEQVRAVARAIALEQATCPWGQDLQVLCSGITDPDLPAILHTGRLQHLSQLSHAAKDLAEVLLTLHQDASTALPWVLVVADQASEQDAWQLADLVARVPHAPIALVLPATGLDALFPEAAHLDCAESGPQPSPVDGQPVVLQRVTEAAYQQLLADLRTTEEPATAAQGAWLHVPESSDHLQAETRVDVPPDAPGPPEQQPEAAAPASPFLAFSQHHAAVPGPADIPLPPAPFPEPAEPALAPSRDPSAVATSAAAGVTGNASVAVPPTSAPWPDPDAAEPSTLHTPQVLVLGPLDITGLGASGRGRRLAELAAYLYLHPHRTAAAIAEAMGSMEPWADGTLRSRMSQLRKVLGTTPDGTPYVPYLSDNATYPQLAVRCDWTRFLKLAERGLTAGATDVADLESALALVRGRPFQGSSASWAVAEQQEMISRIVDVAHTAAVRHVAAGSWDAARTAISKGLDVEPTAEILYRDWITLENRRGDRAALGRVISDLNRALRTLDVEMDDDTQKLITDIYAHHQRTQGTA